MIGRVRTGSSWPRQGSARASSRAGDPGGLRNRRLQEASGIRELSSIGSDTLTQRDDPLGRGVPAAVSERDGSDRGEGSSTAPPALIAGTAQLGPLSRTMKETELDDFQKKYGYSRRRSASARRPRRLREQGQSAREADAPSGGRHLLEDAGGRLRATSPPGGCSASRAWSSKLSALRAQLGSGSTATSREHASTRETTRTR